MFLTSCARKKNARNANGRRGHILILPVFSSKTGDPTCVFIQDWFLGGEEICSGRGGCRDVTRISLSDNTYRVIRTPTEDPGDGQFYLGKSSKGIYCASLPSFLRPQLQTEWVLKHDMDISHVLLNLNYDEQQRDGPWALQHYYSLL
uniref:Uncharacterized protein n=1 Tax=Oryza glumipatula TaxID=40148 RepID=A0A0E0AGJ7_9ORYZ